MDVQKVGWGTGTKDLVIPNVLKVSLGEIKKKRNYSHGNEY